MEILISFFLAQGLNEEEAQKVSAQFSLKKLQKGDLFVQEGKTSKYLGFIEKGFLQYFILLDGEEKTTYSVGESSFVASLVSFLKQVPARENIRAVVNTDVWVIEKKVFTKLQNEIPAFHKFYVDMLEWQICCIDESRLDAIVLTPQERYLKMMDKEPALIQHIPLQYLASILGVTPRHLSRIRNNIR
ncbi:MAG: Crp/Fnr family transcriptional regulator [Chitinophagaceae bacterium]|nr:Crp/Fnr family transcriptional regulator [Chitinophagaceae bacterium]